LTGGLGFATLSAIATLLPRDLGEEVPKHFRGTAQQRVLAARRTC